MLFANGLRLRDRPTRGRGRWAAPTAAVLEFWGLKMIVCLFLRALATVVIVMGQGAWESDMGDRGALNADFIRFVILADA